MACATPSASPAPFSPTAPRSDAEGHEMQAPGILPAAGEVVPASPPRQAQSIERKAVKAGEVRSRP